MGTPAAFSNPKLSSIARSTRITSIDALRGLVMFTMIYVNDLAGVSSKVVPAWMRHFHGKSGMTFVDLVFPAFLFIVGMSIPFALSSRLNKGERLWKTLLHIVTRTLSLLFVGIMMVNESPDPEKMGWSGTLWSALMFLSAIFAFCSISAPRQSESATNQEETFRIISLIVRVLGFASLLFLAFAFRGKDGHRIIAFSPFSIHTEWYGILGLIGWAYFAGSVVFLVFRGRRTALLACTVLLLCLYPAAKTGAFDNFWLANYVGIGETLGSQAAITVAGLLLASILLAPDMVSARARTLFTILFIAGFSAGAFLLQGLYGINKNNATPSWCLWACAITAALWFVFYLLADIRHQGNLAKFAKPFSVAGQNVLLAYLLSEMLPSILDLLHLGDWYSHLAQPGLASAVVRSAGCAVVILVLTSLLNRIGFRLKV
jgi:heparan-alpha-glucosaminide N-acetyltransferase